MFKSNVRQINTSGVALTPPTSATDYRPGLSVIIQHTDANPIFLGGPGGQTFTVQPNTPFPINNIDPGEIPYAKSTSGTPNIQELWQGLGGE